MGKYLCAMFRVLSLTLALAVLSPLSPAAAQDREVPYWASIRAETLNMRVGPSRDYRIAWVYKRKGLPMKVIRVVEGWRLVQDPAGEQGWVVARLLSPERSAIVVGETLAAIRAEPSSGAPLKWNVEPGVVGYLGKCENGFCEFDTNGHKGWVQSDRLWGAGRQK